MPCWMKVNCRSARIVCHSAASCRFGILAYSDEYTLIPTSILTCSSAMTRISIGSAFPGQRYLPDFRRTS